MVERIVVYQAIERFRLDARFDIGANEVHQLGVEPPGCAHHFPFRFAQSEARTLPNQITPTQLMDK
jgi:hypothetical protein